VVVLGVHSTAVQVLTRRVAMVVPVKVAHPLWLEVWELTLARGVEVARVRGQALMVAFMVAEPGMAEPVPKA